MAPYKRIRFAKGSCKSDVCSISSERLVQAEIDAKRLIGSQQPAHREAHETGAREDPHLRGLRVELGKFPNQIASVIENYLDFRIQLVRLFEISSCQCVRLALDDMEKTFCCRAD